MVARAVFHIELMTWVRLVDCCENLFYIFNILFVSFDGDVVGEFERSNATHIVVSTDKEVDYIC